MYKAVEQFMSSMSVMSVCWIKKSPNTGLYIQSSLVNKTRLWAKTGNWHSRRITDFTQITPQREMLSPLSLLDIRSSSCLCIPEELWILPDFHPCQQTTYSKCERRVNTPWPGPTLRRMLLSTRSNHSTSHCRENTFTAWHHWVENDPLFQIFVATLLYIKHNRAEVQITLHITWLWD